MSHISPTRTTRYVLLVVATLGFTQAMRGQYVVDSRIPWPNIIKREDLGPSESLEATIAVGRIIVIGADVKDVIWTVQRIPNTTLLANAADVPAVLDSLLSFGRDTTALRDLKSYPGMAGISFVTLPSPPGTEPIRQWRTVLKFPGDRDTASTGANAWVELRLTVPRRLAHLRLQILTAGTIAVQDYDGDLVVSSARGPVHLGFIGGSALVEAQNGSIFATARSLTPGRPISLMSARGNVSFWVDFRISSNIRVSHLGGVLLSKTHPGLGGVSQNQTTLTRDVRFEYGSLRATVAPNEIALRTLAGDVRLEIPSRAMRRWGDPE